MKRIAVTSHSGGVGKSTVAANLAAILFNLGHKIVLADLSTAATLAVHFGAGLATTESGGTEKHTPLHADFSLVNVGQHASEPLPWQNVIGTLEKYDMGDGFLIIDCPTPPAQKEAVDLVLEIVSAEPYSLFTSVNHQQNNGELPENTRVICNKVDLRNALSRDSLTLAESLYGERLLQSLHFDSHVPEALARKSLVLDDAPFCNAVEDLRNLASAVTELFEQASTPATSRNAAS